MKARKWTYQEELMLCILYPIIPNGRDLSGFFNRSYTGIKTRAQKIGLERIVPNYREATCTRKEEKFIRENYLTIPSKRMANELGRSDTFVRGTINRLGLVIPREIIEQRIIDSRLKKGNTPANKGKKLRDYMSREKVRKILKTAFKKGNIPHNAKGFKNGDITIRTDKRAGIKYKYVRIRMGKWRELHHHLWNKKHGRIPAKHCLRFKDGNSLNCRLSNLELIPMSENMRRNTVHRYPDELRKLIQLKGVLTRKLNQYGNKKQNG